MSIGQSIDAGPRARIAAGSNGFIAWLLSLFAAFHIALIAFLPEAAERFMLGDRANDRAVKLQNLLRADSLDGFLATLFHQASPGDYILFAPAYALAGPTGVMLQNTALILLGAFFLYKLARLFFSGTAAAIATTAYLLLPATLFHPHAFVSEAICNPLLIVATFYLARWASTDRAGFRDLIIAALLSAVLAFTRHIYLLLPLFFAAVLWIGARTSLAGKARAAGILVVLGYSLVAAWGTAAHFGAERYGEGTSVGGLGSNLFLRAQRMAAIIACPLVPSMEERMEATGTDIQTVPPREFLQFVRAHPRAFAKTVVSDVVNITANPGMAMVYGRFFRIFDLGEKDYHDYNKWREVRDQEGLIGLLALLWRTSPLGLILNALGALAWAGFVGVALWGTWKLVSDRAQPLVLKLLLVGLPAYLLGFASIAAGYTRWDHRSPAEFAIAILFAAGAVALTDIRTRRAGSRQGL